MITYFRYIYVSSYAEEWIEIFRGVQVYKKVCVSSYAEEWIEIVHANNNHAYIVSLPTRKSGLKFNQAEEALNGLNVSSYAEEWIEIFNAKNSDALAPGLFLRGRVD